MKRLIKKNGAKQVGLIYHYTDLIALMDILNNNELKSGRGGYISFTRNQNFTKIDRALGTVFLECRLVIDGNLLSENYKIRPYHDSNFIDNESFGTEDMEQEERVKGNISPIKPYIISIDLLKSDDHLDSNLLNWHIKQFIENLGHDHNDYVKSWEVIANLIAKNYNFEVNLI